ncbi:MAG: acetyl-CoA hydrolase/transferase C-terminal domain-containing protein [Sphingomicrobium sp.]
MQRLLEAFRPGEMIYLPGATGEIVALGAALGADPGRLAGSHIVSCLVPGINRTDLAALDERAQLTTFLLPPELRPSFIAGRVRVLPLGYRAIARWLGEQARLDTAIAHVAPPGADGRCSFGIASDFSPIAWRRADRRIAFINHAMPTMRRGPSIDPGEADLMVEGESELIEVAPPVPSATTAAIARNAAALIPDGAAIQLGIGSAPAALCTALGDHRGLRLRSGMAPEGLLALADVGALAAPSQHVAGIAAGSRALYHRLAEHDLVAFADTGATHDHATLAALDRFHAVNSALEVDLFGQANLEWREGQLVSGVGGALDFAHAAIASHGGRSLTLMPSISRGTSRIVPRLGCATVSIGRCDLDTLVTEHGIAELRTRSLDDRAAAIIGIADPDHRDALARAWRQLKASF